MPDTLRPDLVDLIRDIHARGWSQGTGGNFSSLVSRDPFVLLITPSGFDKGSIEPDDLLLVDSHGHVLEGAHKPSAETLLHVPIIEERGAQVVLHTHSVWNTLASLSPGSGFEIAGFEMVKALKGNHSHEQIETVPILNNSQDMPSLSAELRHILRKSPACHAVLLRGHGLYTWGEDIFEARRHLEALEFLFEVALRRKQMEF